MNREDQGHYVPRVRALCARMTSVYELNSQQAVEPCKCWTTCRADPGNSLFQQRQGRSLMSRANRTKRGRDGGMQERAFAKMVASLIHQAGEPSSPVFHAETFSLIGTDNRVLRLKNMYDEYRTATGRERQGILKAWARSWFRVACEVPAAFEDALSDLLPIIRRRGSHECELLEQQNGKMQADPCRLLGEHFAVGVAYDWPECKVHVNEAQLSAWSVGLNEAIVKSLKTLRGMSRDGLEEISPGFWASPWHDDYDIARIMLPDLIKRCEVEGSHVAMMPDKNLLLVTGSEDVEGLDRMASFAEEFYAGPRFLSGIPLILGDGWSPFELPEGHTLFRRYQSLRYVTMAMDYPRQGELLGDCYRRKGESLFVAPVLRKPGCEWATMACWSEGVDTILPKTAVILIRSTCLEEGSPMFHAAAEWDRVQEVVGDLMEPLGLYPERYRVRSFPTSDQNKAINGDGQVMLALLQQVGRP